MKLKIFLSFVIIFSFTISCNSDKKRQSNNISVNVTSKDTYNKWLKDTLLVLQNEKNNVNFSQSYTVNKDSTSLNIKTKIDTVLDNKGKIKNISKDLIYMISLLQNNNIMPTKKFRLITVSEKYYDQPFKAMGLKCDFQIDVLNFFVITDDFKKEYKFMKGNLTDSISITSLPDIQKL